jgi:hypothetical protein
MKAETRPEPRGRPALSEVRPGDERGPVGDAEHEQQPD